MALIPIRSGNAYIGLAKQALQGTAVAPTTFPRWLDLSIDLDAKMEDVWEGDGSRRLSTIIKNLQQTKIKLTCTPRPNELGFIEAMAMGSGSDTLTPATPNTTITAGVTGGTSTSVTVAAGTGLSGSGTVQLLVSAGTVNAEVVTFSLPIATLTLTVAATYNGGKFKNNHTNGDTIAAIASVDTSVTTTASAGATTFQVGNNNGLASFPTTVAASPGTANEEFVTVSGITGTGPYTLTVAGTYNGGVTKLTHTSGDAVLTAPQHVITDQTDGAYYTVEVGLGSLYGQNGPTLRVKDCKVESIKRSAKMGTLLTYEIEIIGLSVTLQGSPSTVTLEQHLPLVFYNGTWTLDGSATGDAPYAESFDISQKNNLDLVQTELLIGSASIFTQIHADVTVELAYQATSTYIQKVYFGGSSGTTDAATVAAGALILVFASPDNFSTITYTVTTLLYTALKLPAPKTDNKHYVQTLQASSTSNQGVNTYLLQTTVGNTTVAPY